MCFETELISSIFGTDLFFFVDSEEVDDDAGAEGFFVAVEEER